MSIDQGERVAILQEIADTWRDLNQAIESVDPAWLTQPGVNADWSVKDVMAHVTAWEIKLIDEIETIEGGGKFEGPADTDTFNAQVHRDNADRDLDDIRADFEATHAALVQLLEVTPALSRELVEWDTYRHYPNHMAQVRAWASAHQ